MIIRRIRPARQWQNSFSNLEAVRKEFNQLLDRIGDTETDVSAGVYPPLNVWQDDQVFTILAELPGVEGKDINLSILKSTVTLSGNRKIAEEGKEVSYHRKERQAGDFKRSLELPTKIDADKIDAQFSNGVLRILIPKAVEERPRQISITTR